MSTATGRRYNSNVPASSIIPINTGTDAKHQVLMDMKRQNMLDYMTQTEEKASIKRSLREEALRAQEEDTHNAIIHAQAEKVMRKKAYDQEERLALELERVKLDKLRDEKMRQQIRESSYEIRELEAKLKEAYVNKERHAQIAEKEAHKFDDMIEDAKIMRNMKEEAERTQKEFLEKAAIKQVEKVRYMEDLTKQLEEREYAKQKAYEEFLKEKLMIDEIVRKIFEEDQREMERKMLSQKVTREYVEEFKRQRELWKQHEREIMEKENKRILEYSRIQRQRDDSLKAYKQAKEDAMGKVQQQLFEQIAKDRETREEMERVRQELYLEEQEQKARHFERENLERKLRQRIDLQQQQQQAIEMKQARQVEQKEEEDRIRQEMLDKYALDDKIELMNAQKRRMKQLEHKRAVEALLDERRQRLEIEKQRELQDRIEEEKLESYKRRIVEEERIKLLREHATRLLGYLPKGVIRNDKDLDELGVEFKQEYAKRQIDYFGDADRGWQEP